MKKTYSDLLLPALLIILMVTAPIVAIVTLRGSLEESTVIPSESQPETLEITDAPKTDTDILIEQIKNGDFSSLNDSDDTIHMLVSTYEREDQEMEWVECKLNANGLKGLLWQEREPSKQDGTKRIYAIFAIENNKITLVMHHTVELPRYHFLSENGNIIFHYFTYGVDDHDIYTHYIFNESLRKERVSSLHVTVIEDWAAEQIREHKLRYWKNEDESVDEWIEKHPDEARAGIYFKESIGEDTAEEIVTEQQFFEAFKEMTGTPFYDMMPERVFGYYRRNDIEPSFLGTHPNLDLHLKLGFEPDDGKFYEIPRLSEEEENAFRQSDDCTEALKARLERYGVFLKSDIITNEMRLTNVEYSFLPMFIGRYKNFDLIYIRYAGYRSYHSGDLYIFENASLKKDIPSIGEIDLENAFRTIGENIWLVAMQPSGGSGMAEETKEWFNLTKGDVPVELTYTHAYATNNYQYGHDIDFAPILVYRASEEKLYINEQNMPTLKTDWQKEVYLEKERFSEDKAVSLIATGYDEHVIDVSIDGVGFNPHGLIAGNLLDGLEEQVDELIKHGTEEEKSIAQQLVDNYATMLVD